MTRKDYVKIAEAVNESRCREVGSFNVVYEEDLIENLCSVFEQDNPNFDRNKFVEACKVNNYEN
jgi:hypothetical protein